MNGFTIVFTHTLKRCFRDLVGLLCLSLIPIVVVFLNTVLNLGNSDFSRNILEVTGQDLTASFVGPMMMIAFQFFCAAMLIEFLFDDLSGARRWRLFAAPVSPRTFLLGTVVACWVYNIFHGLLTVLITTLVFDAYWGNIGVFIGVFLGISVLSLLIGALVYLLTNKKGMAMTVMNVISFGFMIISNLFMNELYIPVLSTVLEYINPINLGLKAIVASGVAFERFSDLMGPFAGGGMNDALLNMGIIWIMVAVLVVLVLILGRKRKPL